MRRFPPENAKSIDRYSTMKTRSLISHLALSALAFVSLAGAADAPDWENELVVGRNKERPHATLMPFENAKQASKSKREESPFYKSLNGKWKFNWVSEPGKRP